MATPITPAPEQACGALPSIADLEALVEQRFKSHPFDGLSQEDIDQLAEDYTAMSAAFPFIQSAAVWPSMRDALKRGQPIPKDWNATMPVATFLVSDELGIHQKVARSGNAALPTILDDRSKHSYLLQRDFKQILGRDVQPIPMAATTAYLKSLMKGLASADPVRRTAMMCAFEVHANRMIGSLWQSITEQFSVNKESLIYFRMHVGGDDPAEAYHVAMTSRMIAKLVQPGDTKRFLKEFVSAYSLHAEWCESIAGMRQVKRA